MNTEIIEQKESTEDSSLNKAKLSSILFNKLENLSLPQAKLIVDCFFNLISENLIAGNDVKISGFGSFYIRSKKPRPGRNPRSGEIVLISARNVVVFVPSQLLKDKMREIKKPEKA